MRRTSKAAAVPRRAQAVPEGAPGLAAEGPQIGRILCPIDFSAFSVRAASDAAALARLWGAEITALFVFPVAPAAGESPYGPPPAVPDAGIRSVVAKDMEEFLRPARAAGVPVRHSFKAGDPAREILAEAAALPADLIVMGTHGRSGFERWLLGSVTDRVLRKAPCPVLTVSPGEVAAPGPDVAKRILCAVDLSETSTRTLEYAMSFARKASAPLTLVHVVEGLAEAKAPVPYGVSQYGLHLETEARDRLHDAASMAAGCSVEEVVVSGRPYREILRLAAERGAGLVVMGTHGPEPVDRMFFGSTVDHVVREALCPVLTVRPAAKATV